MQINKENFLQHYPAVVKAIRESSFYSFDLEFSGLRFRHPYFPRTCEFDTNQAIYERWSHVAEHYAPFQIGISCFSLDAQTKCFKETTFSFLLHKGEDECFLVQADCVNFLARYKFDFSDCFKRGLETTQVRGDIEREMLGGGEHWTEEVSRWLAKQESAIKSFERDFKRTHYSKKVKTEVEETMHKIEDYLLEEFTEGGDNKRSFKLSPAAHEYAKEILIENKLKGRGAEFSYANSSFEVSRIGPNNRKKTNVESKAPITKDVKTPTEAVDKEASKQQMEYMLERLGFSLVFLELIRTKKPLVGHFCIFDLLYIYKACYAPLPPTLTQFATELHAIFPIIYDNKVLTGYAKKHEKRLQSGLSKLYDFIKTNVPKEMSVLQQVNFPEELKHDAGYDSSITGHCFIYLSLMIAKKATLTGMKIEEADILDTFPKSNELYLNSERVISLEKIDECGVDEKELKKVGWVKLEKEVAEGTREQERAVVEEVVKLVTQRTTAQLIRVNKSNFYLWMAEPSEEIIEELNAKLKGKVRAVGPGKSLLEDTSRFWLSRLAPL